MRHRFTAVAASILVLGTMLTTASCGNPLTWVLRNMATFEMVTVPGGTLELGDVDLIYDASEQPPHLVVLTEFEMSAFEVTQGLFEQIMGYNHSWFSPEGDPGTYRPYNANLPVERVTWIEAVYFCNALSEARGFQPCYAIDPRPGLESVRCDFSRNGYRLPTEAEWEYAARGGPGAPDHTFAGSSTLNAVAWTSNNSGDRTHVVGELAANDLGLYDMSGNVWEYVWDGWTGDYAFYAFDPYWWDGISAIVDPHGPFVFDDDRVSLDDTFALRGGGFSVYGSPDWYTRVSARRAFYNAGAVFDPPTAYWSYDTGFRVVRRP